MVAGGASAHATPGRAPRSRRRPRRRAWAARTSSWTARAARSPSSSPWTRSRSRPTTPRCRPGLALSHALTPTLSRACLAKRGVERVARCGGVEQGAGWRRRKEATQLLCALAVVWPLWRCAHASQAGRRARQPRERVGRRAGLCGPRAGRPGPEADGTRGRGRDARGGRVPARPRALCARAHHRAGQGALRGRAGC